MRRDVVGSYAPVSLSGDEVHAAVRAVPVAALHRPPQRPVQVGVRFLEIADDFEVDALDLRQIELFYMNQAQQLLDRTRHIPPAFVTRPAALRDADLRPELLLVHAEPPPDFAGIEDAVENLHWSWSLRRSETSGSGLAAGSPRLYQWHIFD